MNLKNKDIEMVFGNDIDKAFEEITILTLNQFAKKFNMGRRIDIIRFLSQCKHEIQFVTKDCKKIPRLEENLNFKDKTLILLSSFWRTHQKKLEEVRKLPKKEQFKIIMNGWYNGRMGNRIDTDDGRIYVGHGCLMVTGRTTTLKCLRHIEKVTGIECLNGDTPIDGIFQRYDIFWLLGMAYWDLNKMYECSNTKECTNIVNRGLPQDIKTMRLQTAISLKHSSFLEE